MEETKAKTTSMDLLMDLFSVLNKEINDAHENHYKENPTGLIFYSKQPHDNWVYHLYSNGEITCQKGGTEYLNRSEFNISDQIRDYNKMNLNLSQKRKNLSYAILTEKECIYFRNGMLELLKPTIK
jgi:c-di-AMP phosphodiesterase-like protein